MVNRKHPRLAGFDYSTEGAYFVTVCTKDRAEILSSVGRDDPGAPPAVHLTAWGNIAEKYILSIPEHYSDVKIDQYIIMPNHVHLLLFLGQTNGAPGSSRPTLPQIIGAWKRFTNMECGRKLWQTSFYDHVIRDQEDYLTKWRYIDENPARWSEDEYFT